MIIELLLVSVSKKANLLENILVKMTNYSFFTFIKNTKYYIAIIEKNIK